MQFAGSALRKEDGLIVAVTVALAIVYVATAGGGFPLDDSWIHQTYGRNLAETGQWAFSPGIPSAASTSPLYTVLLAIGYRLGINYVLWTHLLGVLALAATGMVGMRMAERLLPQNRYVGLIAGLVLVTAWHLVWAAVSGMETMLFSMLTLVLIAAGWAECDHPQSSIRGIGLRGALFGLLSGLTTLARPEGIILVAISGLIVFFTRTHGSWRWGLLWSVCAALAFSLVTSPYLLLNLRLTGGLLPNTALAKETEVRPLMQLGFLTRVHGLVVPLAAGGQAMLLPGFVYFYVRLLPGTGAFRDRVFNLLPLLWVIALITLYAARLPAAHQHGRYVIPVLPAFIVVGAVGFANLVQLADSSNLLRRILSRTYLISTIGVFLFYGLVSGLLAYRMDVRIIEEEMVDPARWIRENLPPGELLAVHDIGAVGYFSRRPEILDLAGLVSPEVVPILFDKEALYDLMRERNVRYLMAFPYQAPGEDAADPRLCPIYSSDGQTSRAAGGGKMVIFRLVWDGGCARD